MSSERDQIEKYLKAHGGQLTYPTSVALFTESGMEIQPTPSTDGVALSKLLDGYAVGCAHCDVPQDFMERRSG